MRINGLPTLPRTTLADICAAGRWLAALMLCLAWVSSEAAVAPVINSAATARWEVGVLTGYQITASGTPTLYGATGLPSGVSIDTATGLISGTIGTVGTSTVTLSATNVAGTGTATLQLTSFLQIPVITSATTLSTLVNNAFTYSIVAGSSPTAYAATGLPAGLTINTTTGVISGTPTVIGTSFVSISASNSQGTGRGLLTLTVRGVAPVIGGLTIASGVVDAPFNYQIVASNTPTAYGATGLPAGLTLNSSTGAITGSPTTAGVSTVSLIATNPFGSTTATLTVTVTLPVPVITSPTAVSGAVDLAFRYQIIARYNPTAYTASTLPTGLTFNATSGTISGTPTVQRTSTVTITASNVTGSSIATVVTITIGAAGSGGTTSGTTSGTTTGAPPGTITEADDSSDAKCGLGSTVGCVLAMLALGLARLGRRKDR